MTLHVSIYRYDSEKDKKPYMQDFEIDPDQFHGQMVLDVLEALKRQDPTLTFRRSCGEGVCGSDGMNINGKNRLACVTPYKDLKTPIVIRPLPGFPVVRDLVVDLTNFYRQLERAEPYLQNDELEPALERLQTPEERAKLDGLYECILCACCTSSCPSYWWNPDKFLGPAALLAVYRFIADNRDTNTIHRLAIVDDAYKLQRCRSIMNCVDVCPKDLNPTRAIAKIRSEALEAAGA